jgi:carboxypeptidase Q
MRMRGTGKAVLAATGALLMAGFAAAGVADGTLPGLTAIAGRGMIGSNAVEDLEYLSDGIGARLTGTPAAEKAVAWAAERMKAAGLANVHTESFDLKRGWSRVSATAEIVAPVRRSLRVSSFGWVGSTPAGGVEAEVEAVNLYRLDDAMKQDSPRWAGKVLLAVTRGEKPGGFALRAAMLEGLVRKAQEARASAILFGPFNGEAGGMELTHTSALVHDGIDDIPVASLTWEDHERIGRLLDRGDTVRMRLDVRNRVTDGPVQTGNVVGEIRGTEHPDEIVLVGAHLDSWDLADGATDNAFGAAAVLGAAEAIAGCGFAPRRTIRFVLFMGEEQRFLGSLAYTRAHRAEMPDFLAALILDGGEGPVVALDLDGRADLVPAFEPFTRAVRAFGSLALSQRSELGTDTWPFTLQGVPGILLEQDSPDYDRTHHSEADTFDKVPPANLLRDSTLLALAAYWIAARPERLAAPWPPDLTAKLLRDLHAEEGLRFYGLWPFGEPEKKSP